MNTRRMLFATLALALAATALAACREEEQGRPLSFHKGVYEGPKGQQVSNAMVQEMQGRAKRQAF